MKALAKNTHNVIRLPKTEASSFRQAFNSLLAENESLRNELSELRTFRALAYRDPLTGLWNRRYFDDRLAEEISRTRRKPDYPFTLLLVDVNDLKLVNDQRGHGAGDDLLRFVASFLEAGTRAHDLVCRLGGDEFGIILPDCNVSQALAVKARLCAQLEAANGRRSHCVGLSIGAATCADGLMADALLQLADVAMYADKRRQKTGRSLSSVAP